MRALAIIVGSAFVFGPPLIWMQMGKFEGTLVPGMFFGLVFFVYGIGGQKWLRKFAPQLASTEESRSDDELDSEDDL